jgi:hypothetical protein
VSNPDGGAKIYLLHISQLSPSAKKITVDEPRSRPKDSSCVQSVNEKTPPLIVGALTYGTLARFPRLDLGGGFSGRQSPLAQLALRLRS